MMYKRYQYRTSHGIEWTKWFKWSGEKYEFQLKPGLRNEYSETKDAPASDINP